MGDRVRLRTLAVGLAFTAAGVVVLAGWFPGAAASAGTMRLAVGMTLVTLGGLTVLIPATVAFLRYTTRGEDYVGGCPVGAFCSCGHFNFKPRRTCAQCGTHVRYS